MNKNYIDENKENLLKDGKNYLEEMERLVNIISVLRKECPWDRKQNHKSLRNCIIEETYEVAEAIDNEDYNNLREELGDVLLQIVFHSNLAKEEEVFTLEDVIRDENKKMIRRHPHVFSEENVKTVDKVVEKWENIKREEKENPTFTETLKSVPNALPALIKSYKLQKKAASIGFDWPSIDGAWDKVSEEFSELREAVSLKDKNHIEEEFGDLLFSLVNISRFLDISPEEALDKTCKKFTERFAKMEELSLEKGGSIEGMSLDELDKLWDQAKISLRDMKN